MKKLNLGSVMFKVRLTMLLLGLELFEKLNHPTRDSDVMELPAGGCRASELGSVSRFPQNL